MNNGLRPSERDSGIELLKAVAAFMIVLGHCTLTLHGQSLLMPLEGGAVEGGVPTRSAQLLLLNFFRYGAKFSNNVFIIASTWFLADSRTWRKHKWLTILFEYWLFSWVFMALALLIRGGDVSRSALLTSLFPFSMMGNWFISAYLIIYPLHPIMNKALGSLGQRRHLRLALAATLMYFGMGFFEDVFFYNRLVLWIVMYIDVVYIKRYARDFCESTRKNAIALAAGVFGWTGIVLTANYLGLNSELFALVPGKWIRNTNPFPVIVAFALFNLLRGRGLRSPAINYMSGLSMLIYIIHENIMVRGYFRPWAVNLLRERFPGIQPLPTVLLLTLAVLTGTLAIAVAYERLLKRHLVKLAGKCTLFACRLWPKIEDRIIK